VGKLSRTKGQVWEREVAERLRSIGIEAERTLTECRDGNVGDITCKLPIVFQCKVGGRPDIYGAVAEANEVASPKHYLAVAAIKRNGSRHRPPDELAVMPLGDLIELINLLKATGIW
jgi:hypothetical protein